MDEQKECPKSIWDEKPKPFALGIGESQIYSVDEMAAWLEKLKEEWEAMENQITLSNITIEGLDKEYLILREEADKLEAVKNEVKPPISLQYRETIRNIRKILKVTK